MATAKKTEASAPLAGAGLGQIAYEAYCAAVGGKSVRGEKLPTWDEQVKESHDIAAAWCAAVQAALTATFAKEK